MRGGERREERTGGFDESPRGGVPTDPRGDTVDPNVSSGEASGEVRREGLRERIGGVFHVKRAGRRQQRKICCVSLNAGLDGLERGDFDPRCDERGRQSARRVGLADPGTGPHHRKHDPPRFT